MSCIEGTSLVVDMPEMTRYMCGFRTALEPGAIAARAREVPDVEWTVVEPGTLRLQLLGNQTDCLRLEIWDEPSRQPGERLYGLSVATPTREEGAKTFFEWRAKIFEAFDAKLVVTSVKQEIRATLDARRDTLELDGQDLTELTGDIGFLHEHLECLSLSNNRLSQLPLEILCLEKLEELDVSDNLLTELPDQIGSLISLKTLSVAHNRLRELPASIGRLFSLEELRANDNKLRKLPQEIGQLTKLRWLRIQQNRLTELPKEFAQLSLQEWKPTATRALVSPRWGLMAQQNPWVHPPEEIMSKSPMKIRDFLIAHPRRVATDGAKGVYVVYVDDNKHCYEEEWKRRKLGAFADCAAATEACLRLVDGYLATQGTRNAKDLMEAYRTFGEDPWICSDDPGCVFDAWSYAEQRCSDIEAGKPVATNTKTCNTATPPGTA
jgi:hypothetical protein